MRLAAKFSALLLCAVLLAPSMGQAFLPSAASPAQPAGCHSHHRKTPAPSPVSYQCCQGGHHSALLQKVRTEMPVLDALPAWESGEIFSAMPLPHEARNLHEPPGDPPNLTPMRI